MKKSRKSRDIEKQPDNSCDFSDFPFITPLKGIPDTFQILIQVKPNAKITFLKIDGDQLIASVNAPATKGKANKALINLIAQDLHISKSQIVIVRGQTSHTKMINLQIQKLDLVQRMKKIKQFL
ncbi:MAG: DUF167 domain-containing protein [Promethearchaeota archaeon]